MLVVLWPVLLVFQLSAPETSSPIQSIQQTPQGWRLTLMTGSWVMARIHGPVRITSAFIALTWCEQAEFAEADNQATRHRMPRWRVVIWSDQLAADDWRRFSVSLRWRRRENVSGDKILSMSSLLGSG